MTSTIKKSTFSSTGLAFVLAGISYSVSGAPPETHFITEQDVYGDLPVVSTVSRMEQSIHRVPASVSIIDRELIEASGAISWVDVFRLVPGFQAYYINGNRYGIDYHGFGNEFPNHLEVTVDGRSIYNPAFSTINWETLGITLHDVEYIEVVRGSNAPSRGSNAFLGAVNIVTRNPVQHLGSQVKVTTGDRSTREAYLSHNGTSGAISYGANFSYRHNEGFPAVNPGPDGDVGELEDGTEQLAANFRTVYTPNLQDEYDFQAGYARSRPGWGDVDHPEEYSRATFDTHYQSLKWNRTLNGGDGLQIHAYHNSLKGENYDQQRLLSELLSEFLTEEFDTPTTVAPDEVPFVIQGILDSFGHPLADEIVVNDQVVIFGGFNKIETHRYDIELEHRQKISDSLRTTWGAGFRHESIRSPALLGTNEKKTLDSYRLFGHSEWIFSDRITFNGGIMLENNSLIDTIASTRVGINYRLRENHTLRASVARGKRSPSLVESDEFNADIIQGEMHPVLINAIRRSEGDIEEEELTSYELGYIGFFPKQNLSLDLHLFREEIRKGLEVFQALPATELNPLNPDDKFSTRSNIATWNMVGAEVQLRYRPTNRTLIAAHYSYRDVDGEQINTFQPSVTTKNIGGRGPVHTANLLLSQQLTDTLSASINTYHISESDWRDGNFVDEFTRVDAQLKQRFSIANSNASISLIGQNLGGEYSEHGVNNIFETRIYLKLEVDLP